MNTYCDGLRAHSAAIDALNVYPVPDGDTGTNMALTVASVVAEMADSGDSMATVCEAMRHGSLMGARGNSGVILSQILRAVADELGGVDSVGPQELAKALSLASEAAYDAVGTPVEGTILTVMRVAGDEAVRAAEGSTLVDLLEAVAEASSEALARTPEQLPVLAEAGVVDAGASGLVLLWHAFLNVLDGRELPDPPEVEALPAVQSTPSDTRYEVMFLLDGADDAGGRLKLAWDELGDSIVVVGGDGLFNCHVHTNDIGAAIEAGIAIGRPHEIRVTDLAEQVEEVSWVAAATGDDAAVRTTEELEPVATAVVAVSPAAGTDSLFRSLRVQGLVPGGQSMNPSAEALLAAVEAVSSGSVVVLPNNGNVIATAQSVAQLTDKEIAVVPTRSVVEGLAALVGYEPDSEMSRNVETMSEMAGPVVSGEVCRAVRATSSQAGPVSEGDWIGLDDSGVRVVAETCEDAATGLLSTLVGDESELVTILAGEGSSPEATARIREWLGANRSVEVEVHEGGQPHYPYWFGVE